MTNTIINKIRSINNDNIADLTKLYLELYNDNNNNKDYIDYLFYSIKKYEYKEKKETKETIEQKEKRLDTEYRKAIQNKYKRCIITNKPLCVSQVAHIYPYNICSSDEKYDINNGFLLSAELHILFDSTDGDFKIDPATQIISFSKKILEDKTMHYYRQFNNTKIFLNEMQKYYLKKKYEKNDY